MAAARGAIGIVGKPAPNKLGMAVPSGSPDIAISVVGPAQLIGTEPVCVEEGIATVLLQATTEPGMICARAVAAGLKPGAGTIESAPPQQHPGSLVLEGNRRLEPASRR